jgi:hypothetical protein
MKHFKSLTAILVMLTLVLASCGGQNPVVNDASSSTNESTDSGLETEALTGLTPAPTVTITSTAYQNIDLRVETDLAKLFKVTHPTRTSVALTVTSDKDGVLFDGTWLIDPTLFVPSKLNRTFATTGTRTITVTARAGIRSRTGTFYLNVINTAPVIKLHYYGNPHVGEKFWVTAQILDKNEPDGVAMCANTTWTIDAEADVIYPSRGGCRAILRFKNVFGHQLRVTTHDSEGIVAVNAVNLTVLPAFIGTRLDPSQFDVGYLGEDGRTGQTVDMTQDSLFSFAGEGPIETVSYKAIWTLFVIDDQGNESVRYTQKGTGAYDKGFVTRLYFYGGGTAPVTRDCRIAVEITYLGSSSTVPTWVGKCKYNTQTLN